MVIEAIVTASAFGLALLYPVARIRDGRLRASAIVLVLLLCTAGAWAAMDSRKPPLREEDITDRPIQTSSDGYVSSQTCRACHPKQYATWYASYHRTMTQVASPQAVFGDFDTQSLVVEGRTYGVERRGDEFWVEMEDPDYRGAAHPPRIKRRIVMTTGSHHMQHYWYATGDRRTLGKFPLTYLLKDQKRWIPDKDVFLMPYSSHLSSGTGSWNSACIQCHATHGQPMLASMDTRVAELGIACEACHGPAEEHVRANRDPRRRYDHYLNSDPDPTIVNPSSLDHRRSSMICGQCHGNYVYLEAERQNLEKGGFSYRPGEDLTKSRFSEPTEGIRTSVFTDPGSYWSDGMVRVSGREYSGLLETPCYQRGTLSCLSCHAMHRSPDDRKPIKQWAEDQLSVGMDTNQACTQCHEGFQGELDLTAHSNHAADSAGSTCYNCHMPHTSYGLLKALRSHKVSSPSVQESVATGRPNACNQCHLDKTLQWTAEHLERRYNIPQPSLTEQQESVAASIIWALQGDAGQRALMAWSFGWEEARWASGEDWMPPYLAALLADPYHAVRFIALRSLRRFKGFESFEYETVSPPDHPDLSAAESRVIKTWSERYRGQPPRQELLIDATGTINQEVFRRLIELRDQRVVNLQE